MILGQDVDDNDLNFQLYFFADPVNARSVVWIEKKGKQLDLNFIVFST